MATPRPPSLWKFPLDKGGSAIFYRNISSTSLMILNNKKLSKRKNMLISYLTT